MDSALLAAIPLVCLAGATALGAIALASARRGRLLLGERVVSLLACAGPLLAFVLAVVGAIRVASGPIDGPSVPWIALAHFAGPLSLRLDALSATLLVVVTGIGTLIHVYSSGYMHGESGFARYFAYLNLFLFFMTGLVLGANLVTLFVGWEGVGLASFLLIGFWFEDRAKARAGLKAFVVNRVGDAAFLLGIFLVFKTTGSVDFASILNTVETRPDLFSASLFGPVTVASAIGLLFFLGACGKSAQIPLYVWLPDAMAGPTPVSALIHAATMVTAGVYLVCRLSALYAVAPMASAVVAFVGALTALFAATIALAQTDLKKVLAYSTVSQLGFLFLAAGVGAASAATFHLFTHAFFKACLFLGAGSVIHALHQEQDITKMGGLRYKMPVTALTFLVSALALAAVPPFSGFFSKDAILWDALHRGGQISAGFGLLLWGMALAASVCTAFYAFRLVFLVFYGKPRCSEEAWQHCHESPRSMTVPLVLLAIGAATAGFLNVPPSFAHDLNFFDQWLAPVLGPTIHAGEESRAVELAVGSVALFAALSGIGLAALLYVRRPGLAPQIAARFPRVHRLLVDKYRVDEGYERAIVSPLWRLGDRFFFRFVDRRLIDGLSGGLAQIARGAGVVLRLFQTGAVQTYVAIFALAAIAVLYALWGGSTPR